MIPIKKARGKLVRIAPHLRTAAFFSSLIAVFGHADRARADTRGAVTASTAPPGDALSPRRDSVEADEDFESDGLGGGEGVGERGGLHERSRNREEAQAYRNPEGSFNLSGVAGVAVGDGGTRVVVGIGIGYAVFTGVVPGVRGLLIIGSQDELGGELAGTLTLTPPVSFSFTPFLVGEAGRRFEREPFGAGWMYGVGGGLYLGEPASSFALQVGWMFRRIEFESGPLDASGPIVALSIRF